MCLQDGVPTSAQRGHRCHASTKTCTGFCRCTGLSRPAFSPGGHHNEVRTPHTLLTGKVCQQCDSLDSLAQAHLVCVCVRVCQGKLCVLSTAAVRSDYILPALSANGVKTNSVTAMKSNSMIFSYKCTPARIPLMRFS